MWGLLCARPCLQKRNQGRAQDRPSTPRRQLGERAPRGHATARHRPVSGLAGRGALPHQHFAFPNRAARKGEQLVQWLGPEGPEKCGSCLPLRGQPRLAA